MPRFVLLRHDCPPDGAATSHWDLMLEWGDALMTWSLEALPSAWSGVAEPADAGPAPARRLADHRLAYLDYEGPVSRDRGEVRRVARGDYELLEQEAGRLRATLRGDALNGAICLRQQSGDQWTLAAETDASLLEG
jgi:hypothetical protein